jgi:hypothetical protein
LAYPFSREEGVGNREQQREEGVGNREQDSLCFHAFLASTLFLFALFLFPVPCSLFPHKEKENWYEYIEYT